MEDAYSKTTYEVLANFNVSEKLGLHADDVRTNREKYGPNGKINFVGFQPDIMAYVYLLVHFLCLLFNIGAPALRK